MTPPDWQPARDVVDKLEAIMARTPCWTLTGANRAEAMPLLEEANVVMFIGFQQELEAMFDLEVGAISDLGRPATFKQCRLDDPLAPKCEWKQSGLRTVTWMRDRLYELSRYFEGVIMGERSPLAVIEKVKRWRAKETTPPLHRLPGESGNKWHDWHQRLLWQAITVLSHTIKWRKVARTPLLEHLRAHEGRNNKVDWADMLFEAVAGTSRGAYQVLKGKKRGPLASANAEGRKVFALPQLLKEEKETWSHLWEATEAPTTTPELREEYLPLEEPRTGEDVRASSASFKQHTAVVDGMHPKYLSWMTQEANDVAARSMNDCEACGDDPEVARSLLIPLLSKDPLPGVRPIGVFRGFHRVHSQARRRVWHRWEEANATAKEFNLKGRRAVTDGPW